MDWHKPHATITPAGLMAALIVSCGSVDETGGLVGSGGMGVLINEIQPANNTTIPDEHNLYPDWIELYNGGTRRANLEGYFITDDPDVPFKQRLPAQATIAPKGYLLLWAADDADPSDPLHLSFALSQGGEGVWISDPNGNLLDGTDFGWELGDQSYARFPDGRGAFKWCWAPTPEESNGTECPPPLP